MAAATARGNLILGGAGLGVFAGVAAFAAFFACYLLWASVTAAGTDAAQHTGELWIFGGLIGCLMLLPAAIIGAVAGALLGAFYNGRAVRLSALAATLAGGATGGALLLLVLAGMRAVVGSDWEAFSAAYGGGGDTLLLLAMSAFALGAAFIALSHALNRRIAG